MRKDHLLRTEMAMDKLSKEERKRRLREFKRCERTTFEETMPMTPAMFVALLEWLAAKLRACDHTTAVTERFLVAQGLDPQLVLPWLAGHGGYCDCEVLANLDDLAEAYRERPLSPKQNRRLQAERSARSLETAPGWNLERLPKPWRIANLYASDEPLKISLGKSDDCTISIIESPLPAGDQSSDPYWVDPWRQRTRLPPRLPPAVVRAALRIPKHLASVVVSSGSWLPVYCWITPEQGAWHLEIHTDMRRQLGDLPLVAALITLLDGGLP